MSEQGVAVVRYRSQGESFDRFADAARIVPTLPTDARGRWFPEAVAARLVDVDDPKVREWLIAHLRTWPGLYEQTLTVNADAILAALRSPEPRDGES